MHIVLPVCFNHREVCWTLNTHAVLGIVKSEDLLADILNPVIKVVQPISPLVHIVNDPIVDVDEGIFSVLDGNECSVEQLHAVHLIATDAHIRLFKLSRLLSNLGMHSLLFFLVVKLHKKWCVSFIYI